MDERAKGSNGRDYHREARDIVVGCDIRDVLC